MIKNLADLNKANDEQYGPAKDACDCGADAGLEVPQKVHAAVVRKAYKKAGQTMPAGMTKSGSADPRPATNKTLASVQSANDEFYKK